MEVRFDIEAFMARPKPLVTASPPHRRLSTQAHCYVPSMSLPFLNHRQPTTEEH